MKQFIQVKDVAHIDTLVQKALAYKANPLLDQEMGRGKRIGLLFLNLNPIYHLFELVRAPLLGYSAQPINWMVGVGLALLGWCLSLFVFGRYRHRIAYWL